MKSALFAFIFLLSGSCFALSFDQDVPQPLKEALLSDLSLVYQMEGNGQSPLHKEIFGDLKGDSYKNFFESRILSVGLDSCGGGPSIAACVQYTINPHKAWITPNFTKNQIPQIARIMVLFHESRHSEEKNGFWTHDNCPVPFLDENGKDVLGIVSGQKLEGEDACDSTVYGSYGSSTIMIQNIAKHCVNCSEKIKMDADIWATDQAKRIYSPEAKAALKKDFAF